jgi:hypothetical protein
MKINRKHIFFGITVIFAVITLLSAGLVITLRHIDIKPRVENIIKTLSTRINASIAFQTVEIELFPIPCILFDDVNLTIPDNVDVIVRQVRIHPEILPLFRGKFKPGTVKLDFPRSTVDIELFTRKKTGKSQPVTAQEILSRIHSIPEILGQKIPDIRVILSQGKIDLIKKDRQAYWISVPDADIRLSPGKIRVAADCRSNLWQLARFDISMNSNTPQTEGRIDVEDFVFDNTPGDFDAFPDLPVSRLRTSFHLNFNTPDHGSIYGTIRGRIPELTISATDSTPVELSCNRFKGNFQLAGDRARITLDDLALAYPRADLSGWFTWNKTDPEAILEIEGSVEDVATARKVSLALMGRFKTTKKLFAIIREGKVPHISYRAKADSPRNFKNVENQFLTGEMVAGRIVTPGSNLELEDVFGEVTLSGGFLTGKNIRARLGNSLGTEGIFSIGMFGPDAPLYVETRVDADLSQLPPVLARLIKNDNVRREMGMLENTTGKALGKLILKGPKHAVKSFVTVDDFLIHLKYARTPFPISLKGGNVLYEDRQIRLNHVSGNLGQTGISNLDATIDWHDIPTLTATTGNLTLVTGEIVPWVTSFPNFPVTPPPPDAVTGTVSMSRTQVNGPLFHPGQWEFAVSGKTDDLAVKTARLPDAPARIEGLLAATHDRLELSRGVISYGDTRLSGSFRVNGYPESNRKIEADFDGVADPCILDPIFSGVAPLCNIPENALWGLSSARVDWDPGGKILFKGSVSIPGGPDILIELCHSGDELLIERLHVKDEFSDATMAIHGKKGNYDIRFNGMLHPDSAAYFYPGAPMLIGDFHVGIDPRIPENAIFSGNMEISDFDLTPYIRFPVTINKASITGTDGNPFIRAAGKIDGGNDFIIEGNLMSGEKRYPGHFGISFGTLDLNAFIDQIRQLRQKDSPGDTPENFFDAAVSWDLDITAARMDFGKYSWSPVRVNAKILPGDIQVNISEAGLCGINTPGALTLKPDGMQLALTPHAGKSMLEIIVPCLGGKNGLIRGDVDITGALSAKGPYGGIWPALNGDFKFFAQNGRIYRFTLMARIFSILNITEIFRGTLPDLTREGFRYNSIDITGTVSGEKVIITKGLIDGDAMDMLFEGELDIKAQTMDITLLVAPFKTVDFIVKKTPIVKDILGDNLVTIAIAIKGDILNPVVTPLPPSAIGGGLLKILENTLKLPVKFIQPVIDQQKEADNGNNNREN